MTTLANDDLPVREISTSELEAVSAGLILTHGPNPPMGHGPCHPPHFPPHRYYPGGTPNSPGLRGFI